MDLKGKTLLLSGATGGLGREIAKALADREAKLILSSRKQRELKELARELPGGGRRHRVITADLARSGAPEKLIREAAKLRRLDGLVANAGLNAPGRLDRFSHRDLARVLRVNLEAPMKMARELAPSLVERGEGHIVFISSLSGRAATSRSSVYSATKFGLRGFALGLREDLVPKGVGVSIVSPGFVREAGMFASSGAKAPALLGTTTPEKVGRAVARAIERNVSEISVAPRRARALTNFAMRRPEMAGRMTRRGDRASKVAEEIAAGDPHKR
jgi:short-subunit dehydrogenase